MLNPYLEVRSSPIEGKGAFAKKRIPKGTRIIEYIGERITHAMAESRYGRDPFEEDDSIEEPHVYLFTVDSRTIIDGGVNGNDARFINHSCDPSCEAVIDKKRVYIEAIRTIEVGEELSFDYQLDIGGDVTEEDKQRYACRCGSENCRGTMLELPKPKKVRAKRKSAEERLAA